jgi:hypothetical protein
MQKRAYLSWPFCVTARDAAGSEAGTAFLGEKNYSTTFARCLRCMHAGLVAQAIAQEKKKALDTARHTSHRGPSVTSRPFKNLSKTVLNTNTQIHNYLAYIEKRERCANLYAIQIAL